jgi:Secretion system C-terminal sorting domain
MKKNLLTAIFILINAACGFSQIITPIIKANFGVDGELRCNFFNGFVQSGNDDWFKLPGSVGTGQFIIDTAGAAGILAGYTANPVTRKLPFFRNMRFPAYSVINNRLLVDAYFVRDYHGDDSTIFAAGSNKNGMSPVDWSCPVSQSIPDKNEILDVMLHVRRAGPTTSDSLWLMGGMSIENTTGNRYFDFEMYQTDIYYDRATRQFYNYGPDAGHTSWKFDAGGNMTAPGDIILTAEYSSSSLTSIEARIWINKNDLLITPAAFSWTGSFDGASSGSQFGYAGIQPKTIGAFYTGLQSVSSTWAGAFSLVLGDNSIQTTYTARQYMEYSVNLTKLGLDQAQIFGGDDCQMPFRRVMMKTRASTSFTAELKDFVAPFDFFIAPKANIETQTPIICDTGSISNIYVLNPIATSVYQWSTINGNIVGSTTGTSINVDTPGVYIVKQYLQAGCSVYATDTITIDRFTTCSTLSNNLFEFRSVAAGDIVWLQLKIFENQLTRYFDIERSMDGINFQILHRVNTGPPGLAGQVSYNYADDVTGIKSQNIYYRVKFSQIDDRQLFSNIIKHQLGSLPQPVIKISPNPVKDNMQIQIYSSADHLAGISLYDQMGQLINKTTMPVQKGSNVISLNIFNNRPAGIYQAVISLGDKTYTQRVLHVR